MAFISWILWDHYHCSVYLSTNDLLYFNLCHSMKNKYFNLDYFCVIIISVKLLKQDWAPFFAQNSLNTMLPSSPHHIQLFLSISYEAIILKILKSTCYSETHFVLQVKRLCKMQWTSLVAQWWRIHMQCTRCGFDHWIGKSPWRTKWQFTLVFLPGKSHGQKSLRPWGHKRVRPNLMAKQQQHNIQYLQDKINIFNELKIHSSVKWNTR